MYGLEVVGGLVPVLAVLLVGSDLEPDTIAINLRWASQFNEDTFERTRLKRGGKELDAQKFRRKVGRNSPHEAPTSYTVNKFLAAPCCWTQI